ncbi:MAG: prephenate dehydratase domain-containing protein [Solirubrobacteraceae bacterium]|nr:prephenate dehydratase domain-containing protein [Solirubrobacteraceae bacterium]
MTAPVVGFLGPNGTFSEAAAQRLASSWAGELVPVASIINLIQSVTDDFVLKEPFQLDAAVVPIENSTEGSVGATLDTLVDHEDLVITAELDLPIEQLLVARAGLDLASIEQVYSHPQGIAQTRRFLAEHLPNAGIVPTSSTSKSVQIVTESTEPWAAIGSRRAAELYGATILRDDISEQVNVTRFVLVERRGAPVDRSARIGLVETVAVTDGGVVEATDPVAEGAVGGEPARQRRADDAGSDRPMKTSVVFQGQGDGSPGWLVRCLSEFAFRRVNLSKIESRPLRGHLGHYRFFIDMEGSATDPDPADAIEGLRHHATDVRILGSYPVAGQPVAHS